MYHVERGFWECSLRDGNCIGSFKRRVVCLVSRARRKPNSQRAAWQRRIRAIRFRHASGLCLPHWQQVLASAVFRLLFLRPKSTSAQGRQVRVEPWDGRRRILPGGYAQFLTAAGHQQGGRPVRSNAQPVSFPLCSYPRYIDRGPRRH